MTPHGPEQFPNEPFLPLVTEETLEAWGTRLTEDPHLIVDAHQRLQEEQPVLRDVIFTQPAEYPVDNVEIARMTFSAISVFTMLEMQAKAERPDASGPLLPVVTGETVRAWVASSAEMSESKSFNTFRRIATDQLPMAVTLQGIIDENARDTVEAGHMMTTAVSVYTLLEMQAEAERLNQQFNPNA
jgi:hypothetical protein